MRIKDIKWWLVEPTGVYVKIISDEGVAGYGEATNPFMPQAVVGALKDMKGYLLGEDPLRIEYLWQSLFRDLFMRGGPATMAAISGIDMALYDLKGKVYGVPVYELLGGLVRNKLRLYGHIAAETKEEMVEKAKRLAATGCTMIRFRAFHDSDARHEFDFAAGVAQQAEYLEAVRKAVGDKVDLILECHGRYDLPWAVKIAQTAEKFNVFFLEDPLRQENPAMMAALRAQTKVPIATGERSHHKWDFRELFAGNLIDYARPDICHCGGITEMKKIAAFAEVYGIALVPHNTQGPLAYAASLHTSFTVDNLAVMEAAYANPENISKAKEALVKPWPDCVDGYSTPPKGPGLGVEVNEDALNEAEGRFKDKLQPKLRAFDGSVRDW